MMSKLIKYFIGLLLLTVGGYLFYNKVYIPKTTYKTVVAQSGDIDEQVFGIGNVGAKNTYLINAGVGSKILSILTDEGKWVKKGDLLVSMDEVDLPKLLEQAKISVKKAEFALEAAKKGLKGLEVQKRLALITYKRYASLKKQSFASQAEYDKAKADLNEIKSQIEVTKAQISSAKSEIQRAKKNVEALEVKISKYKIYSPVDGFVIAKEAEVSQDVLPNQTILKIVDPKTVWVKTYIDEKISGDIKVGQKATIALRSQKGKKLQGYVKRIVAQSDAVTLEREVDVAFDKVPIPFYINEQAEVVISTKSFKDLIKIPAKLVVYKDEKAGVWVAQGDKAHFKKIKIIARGENFVGVSGIEKNDKLIVVTPKNKPLKEGMRIHL